MAHLSSSFQTAWSSVGNMPTEAIQVKPDRLAKLRVDY